MASTFHLPIYVSNLGSGGGRVPVAVCDDWSEVALFDDDVQKAPLFNALRTLGTPLIFLELSARHWLIACFQLGTLPPVDCGTAGLREGKS